MTITPSPAAAVSCLSNLVVVCPVLHRVVSSVSCSRVPRTDHSAVRDQVDVVAHRIKIEVACSSTEKNTAGNADFSNIVAGLCRVRTSMEQNKL